MAHGLLTVWVSVVGKWEVESTGKTGWVHWLCQVAVRNIGLAVAGPHGSIFKYNAEWKIEDTE